MRGEEQELETLINEVALLLSMYLRNEKKDWIPRIRTTQYPIATGQKRLLIRPISASFLLRRSLTSLKNKPVGDMLTAYFFLKVL